MECAVVEYLANALWQVPLLVVAVAGLLWALGSDVRTRHRVWLAVLAVSLLLPLRGMESGASPADRIVRIAPAAAPAPSMAAPHGPRMATPAAEIDYDVTRIETPQPAHAAGLVLSCAATRWIVRLYGALFAFFAWRVLRAWIAAQGLLRRSRSIDLAPRAMAIFAQTAAAQNVPLPRLRQSDETVSPVVIGALRPVLLLPAGFDRLKDDEILAALSHEFAHLARRDYLVNLICQIGALPLAWHPAIHYVHRRIRDTREMLCDAAAAQEMASPVRYATCLVAFALRALDGRDGALATQGLSMFDNRILEERILQLTQAPEQPEPSTRLVRLAGASIGLAMAVAMALLFHITPTWADTPVAVIAEPPTEPVQLTPQIDLPAAPVAPAAVTKTRHGHTEAAADDKSEQARLQREVERNQAQLQRDAAREQAEREREVALQQREEAQRQREAAHEESQRQREVAQLQREEARRQRDEEMRQRDRDRELAERERERAEQQRDAAEQQREAAREAMEGARREAVEASRAYAAEVKRQVAEAVKAGQVANEVDMETIKQEIAQATASVHGPEFKAQMAELQNHIQQLHDHMAELRAEMKVLNHEVEKSVNAPM